MLDFAERTITPLLSPGEKLLWSGKPHRGVLLRKYDWVVIPVSIGWCLVAVGILPGLWGQSLESDCIVLAFALVGAYFLIGRFAFDALVRANTTYGLTDQRAIILRRLFSDDVISVSMRSWSDFDFAASADGSGTITFGPPPGMAPPGTRGSPPASPAFEAIDDAARVYGLVRDVQQKAQAT
jgi:hypothetical protein